MSPAEQADFEQRLRDDAELRHQVANERAMMRQIVGGISAELRHQSPPARLTFAAIAPKLRPPSKKQRHQTRAASVLATVALLIFVLAFTLRMPDATEDTLAPIVQPTQLAPEIWLETPTMSVTTTSFPFALTKTVTQTIPEHPTIPTRVPTIDVPNTGDN